MIKVIKFAWRHRGGLATLALAFAAGFAAFCYAVSLDEGTKRHLRKRLSEARKMPGRLLT